MPILSVNIDHVATVRQARRTVKPDPIEAAEAACRGGARGITVHLREDRRHIQDGDVQRLAPALTVPLNFEMAATDEMVEFALSIRPHSAMLVPEGRAEITTEGGLDVQADQPRLQEVVRRLGTAGIPASAFIDAKPNQIAAAAACGFEVCEVHTGPWAHAARADGLNSPQASAELDRVRQAGATIIAAGMRFNAGHALDYPNVQPIAALNGLCELHIGHSIVARSILTGMQAAVREMVDLIEGAHA
ncbi:MAG: pyridoxine 5'-phosphate synthase [Phycisphaerales bacterium]|jgi:pyridoxine 5-phosphate synthase|nr:pyridoxine 5'-phosphate synthase [Phycisphaerales bacterium]